MSKHRYPIYPVLLIDDEPQFLLSASMTLSSEGINHIDTCEDPREAIERIKTHVYSVVVVDMSMPHVTGIDVLNATVQHAPDTPVIIITALNDVDTAVESMKAGAFEYILKPVDDNRLVNSVRRAIELREMRDENLRLKQSLLNTELKNPEVFATIITQDEKMESLFRYIEAIAPTSLPVLVTGETGVGKELIATAVHEVSKREGELVTVNVAGVDDTLFSDTLFGHQKGAFTGAEQERRGLIEQARGGTLFLDEIGDLSMESQVKLLRLIQEGKYYPLGSDKPKMSDARIIVATHKDIMEMQKDGTFRKDLYYRLQAHHIHIPPLKERKEDIPLLMEYFLSDAAKQLKKTKPTVPRSLPTLLKTYAFPGNIRELEGLIFDAVSRHESGVLSTETIKQKIVPEGEEQSFKPTSAAGDDETAIQFSDTLPTLKEIERLLIKEALHRSDQNQTIAARMLGISRRALNNRIQRDDEL
jgi:DNA-binding NtrC family response regulator